MTESELLANGTFIGLCGRWEADRWCPIPMIDFCLDHDWPEGADAARWAVEKEERIGFGMPGEMIRTYPWQLNNGEWSWWDGFTNPGDADEVPMRTKNLSQRNVIPSFPAAIAYYLTHFDPILAAKYPPKREAVSA